MLTHQELEQILAVIQVADPASDCAIGLDEIGRARDLVERELMGHEIVDLEALAAEFTREVERVLAIGLRLNVDITHAHEIFQNARDLKKRLSKLLNEQWQFGFDEGLDNARKLVKKALGIA